jgi:hypothetical protein
MFRPFDSRREERRFWTGWHQALPDFKLILISQCRSQLFEVWHILKRSVCYFYVLIVTCILVTRQQDRFSYLYVFSRPTSLLASIKICVLFFTVAMLTYSRFTSSACARSGCVLFKFSPNWFS